MRRRLGQPPTPASPSIRQWNRLGRFEANDRLDLVLDLHVARGLGRRQHFESLFEVLLVQPGLVQRSGQHLLRDSLGIGVGERVFGGDEIEQGEGAARRTVATERPPAGSPARYFGLLA